MNAWDRREGEPNKLFARFQIYLLLGPSRSMYAAYLAWREREGRSPTRENAQKRGGLPKSWGEAASKWEWAERAEKFDEHDREQQIAEWARRRDELREQEWKFSQDLLDKARQMLVFPLAKTVRTQQQGDQTIVTEVHPTRWNIGDVARYLEAASKLGRLAVGESTERVAHTFEVTTDEMNRAVQTAKEWETNAYGQDSIENGIAQND